MNASDRTTKCIIAYLQRVALDTQLVVTKQTALAFHLLNSGLQGGISASDVLLRHLQTGILPDDQCPLTALDGPRMLGAQPGDGVERSLILSIVIERLYLFHQWRRLLVLGWLTSETTRQDYDC